MKRLRKFLNLTTEERQLLISIFVLLGLIRLGLWLLPFQTWRRLLARMTRTPTKVQEAHQASVGRIIWAVVVASRYMPGEIKCLAQALTAQVELVQCGYPADLRIGVAKSEGGQLEAHAWIESQGQTLIGGLADLSRYTPLLPLEVQRP